jgi:DNA-binding PadR family transcriptional regulator
MLKFIIEGLLMQNDMSGYDINLHMQDAQLFKAGFGNIYPTLKKLETAGSIGSREIVETGRYKKIYTITEKGKKEFLAWLEQPMEIKKSNDDYLIKMYFYQYLPQEKVKALISEFIGNLHALIRRLEVFESVVKNKFNIKNFYFQTATLHFGIDQLRFLKDWYQKFLDGLKDLPFPTTTAAPRLYVNAWPAFSVPVFYSDHWMDWMKKTVIS